MNLSVAVWHLDAYADKLRAPKAIVGFIGLLASVLNLAP
jgi:hypothetical protein